MGVKLGSGVGCGACEAVCPRHAIALVGATLADHLPEGPGKPAIAPNLADYDCTLGSTALLYACR